MPTSQNRALVGIVCDDRADVRHVVGRLLGRCGITLGGVAEDYLSLRELVRTANPAVAVVTLPLPGMDGLRAVRELREIAPDCQIVLLSAFGQLDVAAVEAGAAALVLEDDLLALQHVLQGVAQTPPAVSLPEQRAQSTTSAASAAVTTA